LGATKGVQNVDGVYDEQIQAQPAYDDGKLHDVDVHILREGKQIT
jgi:hypothetical protein